MSLSNNRPAHFETLGFKTRGSPAFVVSGALDSLGDLVWL